MYARYNLEDIRQEILRDKGERATQNELYIMDAISVIKRWRPGGCERLYYIPSDAMRMTSQECKRAGYKRDKTILEQLGRALTQDNLPEDDIVFLTEKAAEYKAQGYTSKAIAAWIRAIRIKVKGTSESGS